MTERDIVARLRGMKSGPSIAHVAIDLERMGRDAATEIECLRAELSAANAREVATRLRIAAARAEGYAAGFAQAREMAALECDDRASGWHRAALIVRAAHDEAKRRALSSECADLARAIRALRPEDAGAEGSTDAAR